MDNAEISETLKAAESYLEKLKNIDEEIKIARKQITGTSDEAEHALLQRFTTLKQSLSEVLANRKTELLSRIQGAREESVTPLSKCNLFVEKKIIETEKLIELGKTLQEGKGKQLDLENFTKKSALLGSLPEVPALKEVPYITFDCDSTVELELVDLIGNFGVVSKIAPVQICQMTEKPGAILVEWHIVDLEEKSVDIQEFCLQKAYGDGVGNKLNFETCYQGADSQYLVKDLKVNEFYSFRVSCKYEGSNELSRWSLPQKFSTSLKPFSWKDSEAFSFNNDLKIANPIKKTPPLLLSDGRQFKVGYTIEFTVLEKDEQTAYLGIISDDNVTSLAPINYTEGSFVINSQGEIKVDGLRKSTQLSAFSKGSKICFSCECMRDDKVVVHIDLNDKRVTYEWGVNKSSSFYFAAELPTPSWKIMVE